MATTVENFGTGISLLKLVQPGSLIDIKVRK